MKLRTKTPIIICALHLLRSVAPAATIVTGPGDFLVPTTLVNFETFPGGGIVPYNTDSPGLLASQWSAVGVLISDSSPGDGAGAYSGTFSVAPHSGTRAIADSEGNTAGGFVDFRFVLPGTTTLTAVGEAGLWVQNGDDSSTVSFFDANGMLIQSITPSVGDRFAGIRAAQGIASIRISDSGFYMVDDLQFAVVPEPSSVALLALGVVVFTFALCKRSCQMKFRRPNEKLSIDRSRPGVEEIWGESKRAPAERQG